jgi:hypothetical protein
VIPPVTARPVVSLCLALLLVGCASERAITAPEPVTAAAAAEPAWRQDKADLLNYFLGHRPEGVSVWAGPAVGNYAVSHTLALDWEGGASSGRAWWVTRPGSNWQTYRWDGAAVYFVADRDIHMVDGNREPMDSYGFSEGIWLPRRVPNGYARGRNVGNRLTWYRPGCEARDAGVPWAYEWEVTGPVSIDHGGDVGVDDTVLVRYIWAPGQIEEFAYSWRWGWVRWAYIADGREPVVHRFVTKASEPAIHGGGCS